MLNVLISLLLTARGLVRSRAALHLEVLALRHQLPVLGRSRPATAAPHQTGPVALDVAVPIGSIRRECLDHVVVVNARGLRRVLSSYVEYYLRLGTHLSLDKDAPVSRPVAPTDPGAIVAIPQLAGLHHRYERRAA